MPKRLQARAKTLLHEMMEAPSASAARQARERFRDEFAAKYPKAMDKLDRDWRHLTAFYAFPAEHWRHLRTTNPIESSFATVKLRTRVTKGAGSKAAALAMAFKLLKAAEDRWRRFNGQSSSPTCSRARPSKTGSGSPTSTRWKTRRSPPELLR